jgi:hypothetical protein
MKNDLLAAARMNRSTACDRTTSSRRERLRCGAPHASSPFAAVRRGVRGRCISRPRTSARRRQVPRRVQMKAEKRARIDAVVAFSSGTRRRSRSSRLLDQATIVMPETPRNQDRRRAATGRGRPVPPKPKPRRSRQDRGKKASRAAVRRRLIAGAATGAWDSRGRARSRRSRRMRVGRIDRWLGDGARRRRGSVYGAELRLRTTRNGRSQPTCRGERSDRRRPARDVSEGSPSRSSEETFSWFPTQR